MVVTVDPYEEKYWEIYDQVDDRIIAHFFDETEAGKYAEWLNGTAVSSETSATD